MGRGHIGIRQIHFLFFFSFFHYSNLGMGAGVYEFILLIISLKSVFLGLHSIHSTYKNTFKTMYNNDSGEGGVLMLGPLM